MHWYCPHFPIHTSAIVPRLWNFLLHGNCSHFHRGDGLPFICSPGGVGEIGQGVRSRGVHWDRGSNADIDITLAGNIESRVGLCSQRQNMKNENRKEEHEAVDIEALTWSEDQPSCPGSELLLFGIFPRYIHLAFVA